MSSFRQVVLGRTRPWLVVGVLAGPIAATLATPGGAGAAPTAPAAAAGAPGGPGAPSYLDVARKDCFGTARDRSSKVWFTVAGGALSDVYYPTIESSDIKTVQFIVTDGKTFADLQQRDMTYRVSSPDRSGMVCRVTSTDTRHGFQIVTSYIAKRRRLTRVIRLTPSNRANGTTWITRSNKAA